MERDKNYKKGNRLSKYIFTFLILNIILLFISSQNVSAKNCISRQIVGGDSIYIGKLKVYPNEQGRINKFIDEDGLLHTLSTNEKGDTIIKLQVPNLDGITFKEFVINKDNPYFRKVIGTFDYKVKSLKEVKYPGLEKWVRGEFTFEKSGLSDEVLDTLREQYARSITDPEINGYKVVSRGDELVKIEPVLTLAEPMSTTKATPKVLPTPPPLVQKVEDNTYRMLLYQLRGGTGSEVEGLLRYNQQEAGNIITHLKKVMGEDLKIGGAGLGRNNVIVRYGENYFIPIKVEEGIGYKKLLIKDIKNLKLREALGIATVN